MIALVAHSSLLGWLPEPLLAAHLAQQVVMPVAAPQFVRERRFFPLPPPHRAAAGRGAALSALSAAGARGKGLTAALSARDTRAHVSRTGAGEGSG